MTGFNAGGEHDPYWAEVVLLMNLDLDMLDAKGHTVANTGGVSISSGAAVFNGSNYLSVDHSDFAFSAQNYTAEFYVKLSDTTGGRYLFSNTSSAYIWLGPLGTGMLTCSVHGNATTPVPVSPDQWMHVAFVRDTTARLYIDGVLVHSVESPLGLGGSKWEIGRAYTVTGGGSPGLNGYIRNVRFTKGVARYTTNFTPPTAPFPNS